VYHIAGCAVVVGLLLPSLLAVWGTACFLMNSFLLAGHIRATTLESVLSVVFSLGSFVALCAAVGQLTALLLRDFGDEYRATSFKIAFGVLAGAVAGALATGVLTVSSRDWPFGVYDATRAYWLWGPALAGAGGTIGAALSRDHHAPSR
jgi:hypothetical protein